MSKDNKLKITLIRSLIGRLASHQATVKCLGLSRIHQSVVHDDNACIRGMINKVNYLLKVEEHA